MPKVEHQIIRPIFKEFGIAPGSLFLKFQIIFGNIASFLALAVCQSYFQSRCLRYKIGKYGAIFAKTPLKIKPNHF